MLHAVLAVYILCFAAGVALVIVSFLASRRFSLPGFRDFALLFVSSTLIMIVEALKTYERAVASDFGYGLHVAAVALTLVGNAGMAGYLLSLAMKVARVPPSRVQSLARGILAVAIGLLGGLKEAVPLLWPAASPTGILWNANYLVLLGVHVFAAVTLFSGYRAIESPWLQSFVRSFLIILAVFVPLAAAQLVIQDLWSTPDFLRDYPFEQMAYYLAFAIVALIYLARYFILPSRDTAISLLDDFVRKYGISNREREIIEMMAKGISNSAIAQNLFISTLTVKNHVYQKTGAQNKVQLLNMVNSPE
ncbi:MAG: LuxR C-terminal-related transcriptional regulator [Spirochaetia bacterium]